MIGAGATFRSALMGSVGPIMAPFFLPYGFIKAACIGTEAMSTVECTSPSWQHTEKPRSCPAMLSLWASHLAPS